MKIEFYGEVVFLDAEKGVATLAIRNKEGNEFVGDCKTSNLAKVAKLPIKVGQRVKVTLRRNKKGRWKVRYEMAQVLKITKKEWEKIMAESKRMCMTDEDIERHRRGGK